VGGPEVENDGKAAALCHRCCCHPCSCQETGDQVELYFEDEAAYEDWLFDKLYPEEAD
jgi:hypothetical protein